MANREYAVCFSGHRPKNIFHDKPYDERRRQDYQKIVDRLTRFVLSMVDMGYTRFVTGGAQGFDQLAFWAVHNVKKEHPYIKNIVYIPFQGQERCWAKTGLFSQHEYAQMIRLADEVKVCVKDIDTQDFKQTVRALMHRNECMVNDTDYVLGQYGDDSWQDYKTKGGTAACLRYAKKLNKPIQVMDTDSLADCRLPHNPLPAYP